MWCWTLCNSRNVSRGPEGRLLLQQPLQAWLQEQLSNQRSGNTMYCCCQKCLLYVTTVCCVSVSCLLLLQAYIITSYIPTLNKEVLFSLFELIVLVSCLVWSAEESRITKDLWPDVVHHCGDMTAVWMLFLLHTEGASSWLAAAERGGPAPVLVWPWPGCRMNWRPSQHRSYRCRVLELQSCRRLESGAV